MQVDVEVFGTLRGKLPGDNGRGKGTFELPEDTTISQALDQLNIPAEIRYIIMLNENPEHDRDCDPLQNRPVFTFSESDWQPSPKSQ